MTVSSTTHLNFRGDAKAALDFYASVVDGDVVAIPHPGSDQIMWGQVTASNGFRVMAYDVPEERAFSRGDDPFFLSVRGDSAEEITTLWERLAEGATITAPLAESAWAPLYGMLTDRFGITWVLDVAAAYTSA
jgi:PhnB protein